MLVFAAVSFLLLQPESGNALLAARIQRLLQVALTTNDQKQEEAAATEARKIFTERGLPPIAEVGDEAAYEFVFLACSSGPAEFHQQVLRAVQETVKRNQIPADAAHLLRGTRSAGGGKSPGDEERALPSCPARTDQSAFHSRSGGP